MRKLLTDGYTVWLIGSQVNHTEKDPSDWDFIIFGNELLLNEMSQSCPIPDVDPLVVYDGNNFKSPWPIASDGTVKSGSLLSWKWHEDGTSSASYQGNKFLSDGSWDTSRKRAVRITEDSIITENTA